MLTNFTEEGDEVREVFRTLLFKGKRDVSNSTHTPPSLSTDTGSVPAAGDPLHFQGVQQAVHRGAVPRPQATPLWLLLRQTEPQAVHCSL